MKNRNQYIYKKPTIKLSMGMLALGGLLAIAGCNNSLVDNQPMKATADKSTTGKWLHQLRVQSDTLLTRAKSLKSLGAPLLNHLVLLTALLALLSFSGCAN